MPGSKPGLLLCDKYLPDADKTDSGYVAGHSLAAATAQVLKAIGDELTRETS